MKLLPPPFDVFENAWWAEHHGKLGVLEADGQFDELPFWEYEERYGCKATPDMYYAQ